jgi:hypothetical protein
MAKVDGTTTAYDSQENKILNTHRVSGMKEIGNTPGNLAVTSTNIEVYSNSQKVGFVQTLTPSESRNIIKVQELGTEGVVQSVPSNTQGGQLAVSRFALYNSNLYNALGLTRTGTFVKTSDTNPGMVNGAANTLDSTYKTYGNPFKTLKDQRVPLEVIVKTKLPSGTDGALKYYTETYVDCWLSSYTKTIGRYNYYN